MFLKQLREKKHEGLVTTVNTNYPKKNSMKLKTVAFQI